MYNTKLLTVEDYEKFENLYNDFCSRAKTEYNFELEPLNYDDFLNSVENELIQCIILYDNHEPAGTAGVPMLEAIKKSGIEDITACVVRYFGGIKLGAGGLIRAYSGSVSNAIAHAKKVEDVVYQKYRIQYPYEMSGSLETWLRRNTEIDEFLYDEKVTCYFLSNNPDITKKIQDITKGRVEPVYLQDVKKETGHQDVHGLCIARCQNDNQTAGRNDNPQPRTDTVRDIQVYNPYRIKACCHRSSADNRHL